MMKQGNTIRLEVSDFIFNHVIQIFIAPPIQPKVCTSVRKQKNTSGTSVRAMPFTMKLCEKYVRFKK